MTRGDLGMRKTDIDVNDARDRANDVLEQASHDQAVAEKYKNFPQMVAQALGLPIAEVAQFTIEPDQYCVTVPAIGLHICIPINSSTRRSRPLLKPLGSCRAVALCVDYVIAD
jgi:hypothetical protein